MQTAFLPPLASSSSFAVIGANLDLSLTCFCVYLKRKAHREGLCSSVHHQRLSQRLPSKKFLSIRLPKQNQWPEIEIKHERR